MNFNQKIYSIIDENNKESKLNIAFDFFIIGLIVLNVIAVILESFREIKLLYSEQFYFFELFSVLVFSVEYLLRLYTSDLKYPNQKSFRAGISFISSPLAIIDLLAILPAYLPFIFPIDLRFIRILRLLRITRLFKINRYSKSLTLIGDVFKEKKSDLGITLFVTCILLVIASTLMYHIEGDEQPEAFPNILASFWWAIATLTTVGYGDVYPLTGWGKFISAIIAIVGIGLVALPTGILSSAFIEKINKKPITKNQDLCPTCGQRVVNK